jgi:hypothetical protein
VQFVHAVVGIVTVVEYDIAPVTGTPAAHGSPLMQCGKRLSARTTAPGAIVPPVAVMATVVASVSAVLV